jgi:hypothetical protein
LHLERCKPRGFFVFDGDRIVGHLSKAWTLPGIRT